MTEALAATRSTEKLQDSLQDFYRKRIVRVTIVQFLSRLASDLIINAFDTPWSPHDKLGTSWKSYLTFFWKPVLQFAIFPMQFAYLYSYHPTGNMGDLPALLEAAWKVQHQEDAEKAFSEASKDGFKQTSGPSFFQKAEVELPATVLQAKRNSLDE